MSSYASLREECLEANRALPDTGLVDLTFGNVSVFDPNAGVFAIKPSGVDYDKLRASDMVLLDLDGNVVEGSLNPSSDTPTHRYLFHAFEGIRAIVHTHSRNAVSFAQATREIPALGTTHADYFYGPVPVTRALHKEEIEKDYEWNTGKVIVERFANMSPLDIPAVLVRHHGPFAWSAESAEHAVETALALEVTAQMALQTLAINPAISKIPNDIHSKHFLRKHGETAYYGQKKS